MGIPFIDLNWFSFPITIAFIVWATGMLLSGRFRALSNEIWGHYFLHVIKDVIRYGWAWALVWVLYVTIKDGSLAATLKMISG